MVKGESVNPRKLPKKKSLGASPQPRLKESRK
jgi:hypothetical protein